MKEQKKVTTHRRVITSADPVEYERQFNEMAAELADKNPTIKDVESKDLFCSYFTWTDVEVKKLPETVSEEFRLAGIEYCCKACPHLELGHNKTKKRWPCPFARYGVSSTDAPACELFYKELANGMVKPREPEDGYE